MPITLDADGLLSRKFLKEKEVAIISYYYNALTLSQHLMNPIPILTNETDTGIKRRKEYETEALESENDLEKDIDYDDGIGVFKMDLAVKLIEKPTIKRTIHLIKARTKQIIRITLINKDMKEGYLRRIDVGYDDVYVGEVIVTNDNARQV